MSTARESWGSLRKLPSGRWQVRYKGPDGQSYTARTANDQALTFQMKTDARAWLARLQVSIADGEWEPPDAAAKRRQAAAEAEAARNIGFREYAEQWIDMVKSTSNRAGNMRSAGTVRSYRGKITGYLVPEFGDTPVREIDVLRIRQMTAKLDKIPAEINRKATHNGITRPVRPSRRTVTIERPRSLTALAPVLSTSVRCSRICRDCSTQPLTSEMVAWSCWRSSLFICPRGSRFVAAKISRGDRHAGRQRYMAPSRCAALSVLTIRVAAHVHPGGP